MRPLTNTSCWPAAAAAPGAIWGAGLPDAGPADAAAALIAPMWPVHAAQAPPPQGTGAPNAAAQGGRGGRGGRGAPPGLEPRIVSFEAQPGTVRAGQPFLLVW